MHNMLILILIFKPKTTDFTMKLWGINLTNSVVIPQILLLRSFVLGGIFKFRNSSLGFGLAIDCIKSGTSFLAPVTCRLEMQNQLIFDTRVRPL